MPSEEIKGRVARIREQQALSERNELLGEAPLFSGLDPADLEVLSGKFRPIRVRRGEVIFREGEPAERLFLIDEGSVKLSIVSSTGQEHLIAILGRGQIFGELAVIDRGPRAMDATAMKDGLIHSLGGDFFWTIIESRPALARRLLELMARRLRRADQATQDLVFFDASTRLARRLLELAEEHGEQVGDSETIRIVVRVTQEEMAQMIGVTRESANRLIASFAGRGWIDWNDGYPLLLRPEALMRRGR